MHDFGTNAPKITEDIFEIDRLVGAMCRGLPDTLVIVTADHGLIDTKWRFLSDYPKITECFTRMPSIESRAMTFFIEPNMKVQFEKEFVKDFGDCYRLLTKAEALSLGIFGSGTPHPRAYGFIGDYLAVATGNISIALGESTDDVFKAAHAGMTADEMMVPLIAFAGTDRYPCGIHPCER